MIFVVLLFTSAALQNNVDDNDRRIVGGKSAPEKYKFPYQVSIRKYIQHMCGGSIIATTTILTAAHCLQGIENIDDLTVVIGTNSMVTGGITHYVNNIIIHENYDEIKEFNDIGLIKLKKPITYSDLVQPVSLSGYVVKSGQTLIVSGWGWTDYPDGVPANVLRYTQLVSIETTSCTTIVSKQKITLDELCTVSMDGVGTCKGDSGGPLIDTYGVQVGIVSWGKPCASEHPDIFTRISSYIEWILDNAIRMDCDSDIKVVYEQ